MSWRESLELFRLGYTAVIGLAVAVQFPRHLRWVRARENMRAMPELLGVVTMPRLGAAGFAAAGGVLVASLAVAAGGKATGMVLVMAAVAAVFYFAQVIELPSVRRKPNSVPIILLLLAAVAWLPENRAETGARAAVVLIELTIAQIYLSSALVKLRRSGAEWAGGGRLQMTLLRYRLRDGNRAAEWLARRPPVCRAVAGGVLLFELTFWLVIPFPGLAWICVPLGIVFHAGTAWVMRIHYWIYLAPAYLIFVFGNR